MVWPISICNASGAFYILCESFQVQKQSRISVKRLTNAAFRQIQAFCMYGGCLHSLYNSEIQGRHICRNGPKVN